MHVSKEDQESVFAMLAAVLWLGNVSFTVIDNENHVEPEEDESKALQSLDTDSFSAFLYIVCGDVTFKVIVSFSWKMILVISSLLVNICGLSGDVQKHC